ncbi:DUF456 domain-containing protein [Halosimplex aquaticum]|uniref:DUF456 domain-containing protein n=1 Tax=Halosimplex aquaticum TaxID=3026162 RepID=A0ABD5Y4R8_9EURY|nr:DUF456 domain-containing protein [Halosimplex aquaticum]
MQLPAVGALPVDLFVLVAFVLLIAGVVGSVTPLVPGGVLSLAGVLVYWWGSGFSDPNVLVLSGVIFVALVAVLTDWLAGAVSAKAGGASLRTTVIATLVGLVGLTFGPVGFLLGTAGTVFVLELAEGGEPEESARAAGVTLLGMLTSSVLQVLLTAGVLVAMVGVYLL